MTSTVGATELEGGGAPDVISAATAGAPPPPPPENPNFSISIHDLIESARSDHGTSGATSGGSADYESYRRYCTRRLSRLRRSRDVKKELSHGPAGGKSTSTVTAAAGDEPKQQQQFTSKNKKKGKKGKGKNGGGGSGGQQSSGGKKGGGKFAFHPRPHPDPYDATQHEHYCLVSLYSAERCWSHAMEIKAAYDDAVREAKRLASKRRKKRLADDNNEDGGLGVNGGNSKKKEASPAKIRRHYINKLHKAAAYGTELEERAKVSCDDLTAIEARAYAAWIRGTLAMEVRNWQVRFGDDKNVYMHDVSPLYLSFISQYIHSTHKAFNFILMIRHFSLPSLFQTACAGFGSALTICRALGQGELSVDGSTTSGGEGGAEDLESRDFFASRAEHVIEPLLRYSQYELQKDGMNQSDLRSLFEEQDVAEKKHLEESFPKLSLKLPSTLGSLADKSQVDQASDGKNMSIVHFRSQDISVESKEMQSSLVKIAELMEELEKENDSTNNKYGASNETKFLDLLSLYDDAISIISSDLKGYEKMKAGPAVNAKRAEAGGLLGYLTYGKLKLLMDRNEDRVNELRRTEEAAGNDVPPKVLEQIAHLYDALLQDARSVAQLPGSNSDGDGAEDDEDEFVLEANANILRLRAQRCYYVARLYALDVVDKHEEAALMFEQSALLASRAIEEIAACQDMDESLIESMESLERKVGAAKARSVACAHLAKVGGSGGRVASGSGINLLKRLDDFEAGHNSAGQFIDVPPALEPIPSKPTFFDIAFNHVCAVPVGVLEQHIEEHQDQKSSGGLFGWFGKN